MSKVLNKIAVPIAILSVFLYIRSCRNSALDYYRNADKKMASKDYKGAIKDLNFAINKDPKNEHYYFKRAIAKSEIEEFKGALSDCNHALNLDSVNANFLMLRAILRHDVKNDKRGCEDLIKIKTLYNKKILKKLPIGMEKLKSLCNCHFE